MSILASGSGGGGGATFPAGVDTSVQFNDGGVFGADTGFTYNKTTNTLSVNGAPVGASTPAGLDTQVQFNDGGTAFGGDAGLTFNKTTDLLTATNATVSNAFKIGTKQLSLSNAMTLAATADGSTLNIGAGGTLASGAFAAVVTPAGTNTQVQFNSGGVFGGDAGLTYNSTTDALTVAGNITATSAAIVLSNGGSSTSLALGVGALPSGSGGSNVAIGYNAGAATTTGNQNVFIGQAAGTTASNSNNNVAIGNNAGKNNTSGGYNTFIGSSAGATAGYYEECTVIGIQSRGIGYDNFAIGGYTLYNSNSSSQHNCAIGSYALYNVTSGTKNTAIGFGTGGGGPTTGSNNVLIGASLDAVGGTTSGSIIIGANNAAVGTHTNSLYIMNGSGATKLYQDANNKLAIGTTTTTYDLTFLGTAAKQWGVLRHSTANTAGTNLTINAGGATSAATDKVGGNLILQAGQSTGTGSSSIQLQIQKAGSTGTADNSYTTALVVTNTADLCLPKTIGTGIKVDTATPTFAYHDLIGTFIPDIAGPDAPNITAFRGGNARCFAFAASDRSDYMYHIPHDYVPNQDAFIHVHWGHNGTGISGTFTATLSIIYAKGHNQSTFSAEITAVCTQSSLTIGAYPQYCHAVVEVPLSTAGGSASTLDSTLIEPDGLILCALIVTTSPTITGGTSADPFIFSVDIHYQSTGIGTKNKSPNFYA